MEITNIEVIRLHQPESGSSGGPHPALLRVETDEGIVGIGEACSQSERGEASLAVKDVIDVGFKPLLLGENPLEISRIWEKLYSYSEWYGRRGITSYAISGIDVALWDILGKATGLPISVLLGGRFREKIRIYASLLFDMENPEASLDEAKRSTKDGTTAIKFGWGRTRNSAFGLDEKKDESVVRLLREGLGENTDIMVDVGRYVNWTVPHAIKMAHRLAKYDIFWLEEALPQEDPDAYAELRASSDVYIAAGEGGYTRYDYRDWVTKRAVDILQPDPTRVGLSEVRRITDLCQLWNIMVVPHGFSSAVNVAANLQWICSVPNAFIMEFRKTPSPLISKLIKKPFQAERGFITIPDGPGLGIELDESAVEECTVKET